MRPLLLLAALLLAGQARAAVLTPEEQSQLTSALLDPDRPMKVRLQAALFLGRSGSPTVAPALTGALSDAEFPVRAAAALGLGRVGGDEAVDPLLDRLGDPEPFVREQTREALAELARRGKLGAVHRRAAKAPDAARAQLAEVAALLDPPLYDSLYGALLADPSPRVREAAGQALAARPPPEVQRLLLAELRDPDPAVRAAVARACAERRISPAIPVLADMLVSAEEPPEGRRAAQAALKSLADQLDVDKLAAASAQGHRDERARALALLAAAGGPRAAAALATALDDPDPELRARAALGLAAMGDTAALRRLEVMLGKDENAPVRRQLQAAADSLRAQR